jgi:NF-X1-type zinc finger protein NFXL1
MPLVRPGGATWSLAPPTNFATTTTNETSISGEKEEKSDQTPAQYTVSILERYLTTFDTFESSNSATTGGLKNNSNWGGGGVAIDADTSLFSEALERISEHVTGDADGMAACLICLEDVKPTDPVWNCSGETTTAATNMDDNNQDDTSSSGCYALLHLPCAQAWSRQQLQQLKQQKLNVSSCWGCPKCRKLYTTTPTSYTCFCGKAKDPVFNPWHVAHSCGEECAVKNPLCGHPCMLLCHPGPHPPCPIAVQSECFCGKEKTIRRCGRQEFSCKSMCGRKNSNCGHPCPALCHAQDCPPCIRLVTASCRCGGTTATEMRCSTVAEFRCDRVCQKLLSCGGKHHCTKVCCDGKNCGPCPFSIGVKSCPCGKTEVKNLECGVTVPPCGLSCDKLLACGLHFCSERCHTGPCPQTCRTTVEKPCRCGRVTKTMLCQDESFKCQHRCSEMKSCGRHPCKRRCCDGCPPCEEVCNRRLRCGNHRCPAPCHQGPCSPCPLSIKISCACGQTSYSTPCGRESTAQPPRCQLACSVPAVCRHRGADFPPHRCHFGPCPGLATGKTIPPCPFPCGNALKCSHKCCLPCHDPPSPLDIPPFTPLPPPIAPGERDVSKKRIEQLNAPPAAVPAVRAALAFIEEQEKKGSTLALSQCPPCQLLQDVKCFGGHSTASLPCSRAAPFSCNQPCGAALNCSNHSCSLPCHDIAANACTQCTLPCQKQRPCKHTCPNNPLGSCHSGDCGDCPIHVLLPCHCGKTSLEFPCYRTTATGKISSKELCCAKQCSKPLDNCIHLCGENCHEGSCPGSIAGRCEAETTVRCSCKRLKTKLKCFEVATLLQKEERKNSGGGKSGGRYDVLTSLRMLPCDAECAKSITSSTPPTTTSAAAPSAPSLRLEGQKKRLLQDERAAEAARKEREREKRRLDKIKQQKMRQLIRILLLIILFLIIFAAAFFLRRVLSTVDQAAQEIWGVDS